jgi:dihydroorotase/N-acyl-D-amino-acid deacylase
VIREEVQHVIHESADPGRAPLESGHLALEAMSNTAPPCGRVLTGVEPHSAARRANVDDDSIHVFGGQGEPALRAEALLRRAARLALALARRGKRWLPPPVESFLREPRAIAVPARGEGHRATRSMQNVAIVRTPQVAEPAHARLSSRHTLSLRLEAAIATISLTAPSPPLIHETVQAILRFAAAMLVLSAPMKVVGQQYDILIAGGSVIDGSGSPAKRADVAIRGDRIVTISGTPIPRSEANRVIDATGRTVSPGFIDLHAHLDPLLRLPLAESALRQGVTTALGGPDGGSPLPLAPYLDSVRTVKPGINVAFLIGHNDIRRAVMGMSDKAPTAQQLARMRSLVAEGMHDGAFGLSTGLLYLPGTYSGIDEVVALSQAAADSGGIYTSHLRKEGLGLLDGVAEALEIGRRARIPVVLTHHKAVGKLMWGRSVVTLSMVDSARRAGTDVLIDQYPYTATHTNIGVLVPSWAMAGGSAEFRKRLAIPALKDSIVRGIVQNILTDRGGGDLARVQFARVTWDTSLEGKTLADWARRQGMEPTPENGAALVLEALRNGGANAIYHVLDEGDVRRIMTSPFTMIASDGRLSQPGEGHPHPRAHGTFPRVLGEYVREQKLMSLETAIHKMTGMPAKRLGLTERGVIEAGAFADVVIFDQRTVKDRSTFTDPHQYPAGIETVIVNGTVVVENGRATGVRAGRVLTRQKNVLKESTEKKE